MKAVLDVDAEPWYTARASALGGLGLTRGYAPFPVFFEGTRSEPWGDATEYRFDFGDGSKPFTGMNAAHVYETPGAYTVTLTVTDGAGNVATAARTVEVLEPRGRTYFVDCETGNDAFDGRSPETAWQSADKALLGIAGRYGPGDRILFRRNQTFPLAVCVKPSRWSQNAGYGFGAYGEGAPPLIRRANGGSGATMLDFLNSGLRHVSFQDLSFDGTSPDKAVRSSVVRVVGATTGLLFLRCAFLNGYQHLGLNGPSEDGAERVSGVFVVGCTGQNSGHIGIYVKALRVALLDNDWDRSGENMVYGSWAPRSLIAGNRFARPDFGRTALRLSGGSNAFERPAEYIQVSGNRFEGWVDPIVGRDGTNGKRWNYTLCTMSPNVSGEQLIRRIRWEGNTVTGCETALQLGACEDVLVRGNVFNLPSCSAGAARFKFGSEFERRPMRGVRFMHNLVMSDEARSNGGSMGAVFGFLQYLYEGRHEDIVLVGNRIEVSNGAPAVYWFQGQDPARWPGVFAANALAGAGCVRHGGSHNTRGTTAPLAPWHALTDEASPIPAAN